MKWSRADGMENIKLSELLSRKIHDYGYDTLTALSNDIGMPVSEIHALLNGRVIYPRRETRIALCRGLDIAPEVLDMAIRNSMGGYK